MALVVTFSGVRGVFNKDFTEKSILLYALAYLELVKEKVKDPLLVIGRDTRTSGEAIKNCLIEHLDCRIIDTGMNSTPIVENAVRAFNADAGIIITASHNEPEYNGFKFLDSNGAAIDPEIFEKMIEKYSQIKENPNLLNVKYKRVSYKEKEARVEYINFLKKILGPEFKSPVKVLVDPNGGSGMICKEIFQEFDISAEYINMEQGKFLRKIEPNEASLRYLEESLRNGGYEFALGFDCDADRVMILLKNGEFFSGNQILAIICSYMVEKNSDKKNIVVAQNATSYLVKEVVEKNADFIEVEVGETNVVKKMNEVNSIIGGEGSNGGVIVWPSRCRDGILTSILLLKILSEKKIPLKNLIEQLPFYCNIQENMCSKNFREFRENVKKYYSDKGFRILENSPNGGLKLIKDDCWVLFKQSNTEDNVIRLVIDSKSEEISKNLLNEAKELLK